MINIQEFTNLLPYNTFNIQAQARYFVQINSPADFHELIGNAVYKNEKRFILGGGSNVLFSGDFNGLIIKSSLKGITIIEENDETVTLKAGAGERWHDLVMYCVQHNYGGIENLSLIPGTVGASPIQNIGAYGVEVKDVIRQVDVIDLATASVHTFSNRECSFGYRESIFKHTVKEKYFISSITLSLTKKNHRLNTSYGAIQQTLDQQNRIATIQSISDTVIAIRQSKLPDPNVVGNAGSFFKNPTIAQKTFEELKKSYPEIPGYPSENQEVKIPAGWLIEQCGWKGKTIGRVGVHPHQALVLVNYGKATGEEVWALAQDIIESVHHRFNIKLHPEVNIV